MTRTPSAQPAVPTAESSGQAVSAALSGLPFTKMTGSGNDFVFFDGRTVDSALLLLPEVIQSICNRNNGIGADGIVILEANPEGAQARVHYFNSDGTPADLCGNATLCSTTMSVELGLADASGMQLLTAAGTINSRVVDGLPEIELPPVSRPDAAVDIPLALGEQRIGFVVAGVPHLVVLCDDADAVDLAARGRALRHHRAVGPAGANVNWVSRRRDGRWQYRTYERGVEGETLACGTGAVATAILLKTWDLAAAEVVIRTRSGCELVVTLEAGEHGSVRGATPRSTDSAAVWRPRLRGEGRVVYRGRIATLTG